jgi:hypothetical protein
MKTQEMEGSDCARETGSGGSTGTGENGLIEDWRGLGHAQREGVEIETSTRGGKLFSWREKSRRGDEEERSNRGF